MMTDMNSIKSYQSGTNELLAKMKQHLDARLDQKTAIQPTAIAGGADAKVVQQL
jgi:hypothetical protein